MYAHGRARAASKQNVVTKWPHPILPYTSSEVQTFCIEDVEWQKFRRVLKGVPTFKKLEMLDMRRNTKIQDDTNAAIRNLGRRYQVQVDNYINALKRGGQLNMKLEVVK